MTKKYYIEVKKVEGSTSGSYRLETDTNIGNLYRVQHIEEQAKEQFDSWTEDAQRKIPRKFRLRLEFQE